MPETIRPSALHYRPWLHRFALLLAGSTLALIVLGGMVTSKVAGMSVPDWPASLGHNMFLLPIALWEGKVFWEHTHRLLASGVGLLCIVMAVWLWVTQRPRPWLRWFGVFVLFLVILQGVKGGLRVLDWSLTLAILHGIVAQIFLCCTVLIAAATSRYWVEHAGRQHADTPAGNAPDRFADDASASNSPKHHPADPALLRRATLAGAVALLVIVVQLSLGAVMRHTGAGLAIYDFPGSYGRLVPPLDNAEIRRHIDALPADHPIKHQRNSNDHPVRYATAQKVAVAFAHRTWAVAVVAAILWFLAASLKALPGRGLIQRPGRWVLALLVAQIMLGALVIWTGRHPEITTAHQTTGAVILALCFLVLARVRLLGGAASAVARPDRSPAYDRPGHTTAGHALG